MFYVALLLGTLTLAAFGAARAGLVPVDAGWERFALGMGAGCFVGAVLARAGGRAAGKAAARPAETIYDAKGSTCGTCRRPLLPGIARCPFCNPVVPEKLPVEATLPTDFKPLEGPIAMPGVAAAAKLKQQAGARGYLYVFEGGSKGQSILLAEGVVWIGRGPDNTFILDDAGISQRHAEVRPTDKGYVVVDLGSKNGTFLNDQRVSEAPLQSGDVVALGTTKILVNVG